MTDVSALSWSVGVDRVSDFLDSSSNLRVDLMVVLLLSVLLFLLLEKTSALVLVKLAFLALVQYTTSSSFLLQDFCFVRPFLPSLLKSWICLNILKRGKRFSLEGSSPSEALLVVLVLALALSDSSKDAVLFLEKLGLLGASGLLVPPQRGRQGKPRPKLFNVFITILILLYFLCFTKFY